MTLKDVQLNRKIRIYLMGNRYNQLIHFQNLIQHFQASNRLPNLILRVFSVRISSHNIIIANFSCCVRSRLDPCFRKLTFYVKFKIQTSVAQALSPFTSK
jgi:hypothetical protein